MIFLIMIAASVVIATVVFATMSITVAILKRKYRQ